MSKAKISILAVLLIIVLVISAFPLPGVAAATADGHPWHYLRIIRDDYGVPHVFSDTKEGLGFGAGYAMAQDRLWQADVFRRTASGRLAELLGPSVLGQDMEMRALWYNQDELLQIYDDWDPGQDYAHLKPMIEAYIEGINLYISEALAAAAQGDLSLIPVEYIAQGLIDKLEPFSVADVVAVTVLMAWRFGGTGGNEGAFYEALLTLQGMHGSADGALIWDELFPLNDPGAPVTIPDEVYEEATVSTPSFDFPDGLGGLLQEYEESKAAQDELLESLGLPTKFGSNAVLISPELSETGNALELGGPQMGYTVPQIIYEIGLHGAGISAQGMAFAGAGPFILIGVSENGAWTSTTGSSDVVDIRILVLNPLNSTQYWYDGAWLNMEVRTETFEVRGSPPITTTFYRSHYGPIVGIAGGTAITLHTPFYRNEIAAEQGWQLFQEAKNLDEFEAVVELVWPSHNFYWADREGNIGYWHAGRFPVKPAGADRRLPLMGDGTQEWVRVTDPEEMPRSINPEQGWLTNWNNKPIAGWPYAESDFGWGEGFRVQVLMNALADYYAPRGDVTFEDMNAINQIAGYHHTAGMSFVGDLIATVTAYVVANPGDTEAATALGHLVAWATAEPLPVSYVDLVSPKWPTDLNPTYDHAGLTIFNAWYDRIVPEVFTGILPPDIIGRVKGSPSLLLRVFGEETIYDYFGSRDRDTLIVDALKDAIGALEVQYGSQDMSSWLTSVRMQRYDAQGALPGGYYHPYMNRGTYNQIAEMISKPPSQAKPSEAGKGSPPHAVSVIPPGQSGFVGYPGVPSPYAFDQLPLYAAWQYKHMLFRTKDIEAVETWRRVF
ncbi:MAG: penicillin acylase family protein [Dehalococcoidia bacterium]|nr:penicillin acylase family protein [Dehalococcoidia bacterium]